MGKGRDTGPKPGQLVTKQDPALTAFTDSQFASRKGRKRPRILVGSLTLSSVNTQPYGTHCTNFYQMGRDIKGYDFGFASPRRMAIDAMRNLCVEIAIQGGYRYLYFFDDDTVNSRNVLGRLLPRMKEFNAISASYYIRGYPFEPMVFKWHDRDKLLMSLYGVEAESKIDSDGVLRDNVAAVGCGCTLFRVKDFHKVPYPWFKTGFRHTEDTWFFLNAHKNIPKYKVGMDFNVSCGHLLDPLCVDARNVGLMRRVYKRIRALGEVL